MFESTRSDRWLALPVALGVGVGLLFALAPMGAQAAAAAASCAPSGFHLGCLTTNSFYPDKWCAGPGGVGEDCVTCTRAFDAVCELDEEHFQWGYFNGYKT